MRAVDLQSTFLVPLRRQMWWVGFCVEDSP